jgi:hypothetical protein
MGELNRRCQESGRSPASTRRAQQFMSFAAQAADAVVEFVHSALTACSIPEPDLDRVLHGRAVSGCLLVHLANSFFGHDTKYSREGRAKSVSRRTTPPLFLNDLHPGHGCRMIGTRGPSGSRSHHGCRRVDRLPPNSPHAAAKEGLRRGRRQRTVAAAAAR